jgi:hypothetical protein
MPVRKFRSIEEMKKDHPAWRRPGDPMLYRAIALVWAVAARANPRRFQPGVYRYRSIEEMDRAQEQRLIEHMQALRRSRRGEP